MTDTETPATAARGLSAEDQATLQAAYRKRDRGETLTEHEAFILAAWEAPLSAAETIKAP